MTEPFRTPLRPVRTTTPWSAGVLCSLASSALAVAPGCAFRDAGPADVDPVPTRVTQAGPPLRTDPVDEPEGQPGGQPGGQAEGQTGKDENPSEADEAEQAARELSSVSLRLEANRVVDDWHEAASVGARDRYLGHFSPDAVFLGTDATERWDLATFTAYVDENFRPGRGWSYTPSNRYVILGPDQRVAWFDEALDSDGYGALRGTGVLRRDGDTWRIAHYSMTFAIPNDVAREVVGVVRAAENR